MIVGNGTIGVPIERHNTVYEIPNFFVISMEDVGSILMNVDAFHIFTIDVAAQMRAFVNDKAFLSFLFCTICICCSK